MSESYEQGYQKGRNPLSAVSAKSTEKVFQNPFDELMSLSYANTKEQGDIFEHFCAVLLDTLGYQIINIPGGAGDKGIDINVTTPGAIKTTIAVQCKSFPTSKVGTGDIQKTISLKTLAGQSIDKVALMTSGEFSRPALVMAQENQVDLFDGTRLKELSYQYFQERSLEDIDREGIKWRD